jgi:hypothetical protein
LCTPERFLGMRPHLPYFLLTSFAVVLGSVVEQPLVAQSAAVLRRRPLRRKHQEAMG